MVSFLFALQAKAEETNSNIWLKDFEYKSDARLFVHGDGLPRLGEVILEKEREFKSKPPSSIRGLVVALIFLDLYNEDVWRQPSHLTGGVSRERVRVGDKITVHRKGSARGLLWQAPVFGEGATLVLPASLNVGSRKPGIAIMIPFH